MSSEISLQNVRFTWRHKRAVQALSRYALVNMNGRYGTGFPANIPGEIEISHFHNGYHASTVSRDGHRMARAIGLNDAECSIVSLVGFAHDVYQSFPANRGHDEAESARWLKQKIEEQGILPIATSKICSLAIRGTEPIFDENFKIIGQVAGELEYPSRSAELIAKCVACGDFGILYQPMGPYTSHKLYNEIKRCTGDPPMDGLVRFQQGQVALVETFTYALPEAERVLATRKREVIAYTDKVLTQLQRGEIETWSQLLAQDLQFARKYR